MNPGIISCIALINLRVRFPAQHAHIHVFAHARGEG